MFILIDDPTYVIANAGCKHFDVHGGPEDTPLPRASFDANVRRLIAVSTFFIYY